jgi:hypothetical protein
MTSSGDHPADDEDDGGKVVIEAEAAAGDHGPRQDAQKQDPTDDARDVHTPVSSIRSGRPTERDLRARPAAPKGLSAERAAGENVPDAPR